VLETLLLFRLILYWTTLDQSADSKIEYDKTTEIVECGTATDLTKGRGGRQSEQGYTMP
jgi:hypothetical protein